MNTVPTTMTNPADSQNNHSACAGKKGLGDAAPQQAKCKRCYLCPACYYAPGLVSYYAPGLVSEDHEGGLLKKRNFIS